MEAKNESTFALNSSNWDQGGTEQARSRGLGLAFVFCLFSFSDIRRGGRFGREGKRRFTDEMNCMYTYACSCIHLTDCSVYSSIHKL